MTNRYYALTVLLEQPIRDDDAEALISAIKQLRGVMDVQPHVEDPNLQWARESARRELGQKLLAILYPTKD